MVVGLKMLSTSILCFGPTVEMPEQTVGRLSARDSEHPPGSA